jgi:hypothetical protein
MLSKEMALKKKRYARAANTENKKPVASATQKVTRSAVNIIRI